MKLIIKAKNYTPKSMSFSDGWMGPQGNVGFTMFVDQQKAEKIIKEILKQGKHIKSAVLGLDGDFRENSSTIYDNGKTYNYHAFNYSIWATPILVVTYSDRSNEVYDCWKKQ